MIGDNIVVLEIIDFFVEQSVKGKKSVSIVMINAFDFYCIPAILPVRYLQSSVEHIGVPNREMFSVPGP